MRKNILFISLCLLIMGIIACATQGPGRSTAQREEFHQQVNKDKKITILPPVLQYFKSTNLGNEPMPEFNTIVYENVLNGIKSTFASLGYQLKPVNISDDILLQDQVLARDLTHVRDDFNQALTELTSGRAKSKIYFTPLVNVFAERAQADLLLMVQGYGFETSGGKKAKDAVTAGIGALFGYIPSMQFTATQLVIFLIDGVTGELVWVNYNPDSDTSYNAKDAVDMSRLAERLLSPLGMR